MPSVRTTLLPLVLALLVLPAAASLRAAPAAQAASPLPSELRWSVTIPARPSAPPVLGGGRVFLPLQSGLIIAYGTADGAEAWRTGLRADQPLAVDAGRVFVASGEAIHALSAETSAVLWRAPAGTLSAPMLAQNGWVIAASAGSLAAFRSADGTKVWGRETGPQRGRPSIEGDNLYVPLDDGRLLALDLRTGATRWERHLSGQGRDGSPALSEVLAHPDRVFVGASDGRFYCVSAADGSILWRFRVGAILRGRPASSGTRIFIATMDNTVQAFDRTAGQLLWHPSVPFRPASALVLGGAVVVPGTASEVRAFDAAGHPAGQIKLEDALAVPPAFEDASAGPLMAAVTGSLNGEWKLLLMEAPRGVPTVPLTELPGTIVPLGPPPVR